MYLKVEATKRAVEDKAKYTLGADYQKEVFNHIKIF